MEDKENPWRRRLEKTLEARGRNGLVIIKDFVSYMTAATAVSGDSLCLDPTWALDFALNGTRVNLGNLMTRKRYVDIGVTLSIMRACGSNDPSAAGVSLR